MGLIGKMADKVRNGIRSFLEIQPAPAGTIYINEKLDYESNAIKNKIWYRGQSDELSQLYKRLMLIGHCFGRRFPHREGQSEKFTLVFLPISLICWYPL